MPHRESSAHSKLVSAALLTLLLGVSVTPAQAQETTGTATIGGRCRN